MVVNIEHICSLDIGSNKICCCIAEADTSKDNPKIRVKAYYPISSKAFKGGHISNFEELVKDIGNAVQSTEEMVGYSIDKIIVSISCANSVSGYTKINANLNDSIGDNVLSEYYLSRLLNKSFNHLKNDEDSVVHFIPINYTLDGKDRIKNPENQYVKNLGIDIHYIKTKINWKKNLELVIIKNRLKLSSLCNSAYASGLSCLTEDEKDLGATIIDIGHNICDIAIFQDGNFMNSAFVAEGGSKITADIKSNLKCSMAAAERLKILKGNLKSFSKSANIEYKEDGESLGFHNKSVSEEYFVNIVRDSLKHILYQCKGVLEKNPFYEIGNSVIVLTGGVSLTNGIVELAEEIFEKPVRIGKPQNCIGIPSSQNNPSSSCSIGLIRHYLSNIWEKEILSNKNKNKKIKKIVDWFKENF